MAASSWKPNIAGAIRPWVLSRFDYATDTSPATGQHDLVVATYNVHKCVGNDGVFDPARTRAVIAELDADIVALQEVDERFGERNGLLDLKALHEDCGLVPAMLTPTRNGDGWHGNLVLFREGMATSARQIALPGVEPRGALIIDLSVEGIELRILAAHLGLLKRSRALQVETLLSFIEAEPRVPTLLVGDLNEWRLGSRSSLRALDRAFHTPAALVPTFPASFPVLALDRILGNGSGLVTATAVHETDLSRVASDHLPIKGWVSLGRSQAETVAEALTSQAVSRAGG